MNNIIDSDVSIISKSINENLEVKIDVMKIEWQLEYSLIENVDKYDLNFGLIYDSINYNSNILINGFNTWLPNGWKIREAECVYEGNNSIYYVDSKWVIHEFVQSYNDIMVYIDKSGTGMTLKKQINGKYDIYDVFGNEINFNENGLIIHKKEHLLNNTNDYNTINYTYQTNTNKISAIYGPNSRIINFYYENDLLSYATLKVNSQTIRTVEFYYTNNQLSSISEGFNNCAFFYSNNIMQRIKSDYENFFELKRNNNILSVNEYAKNETSFIDNNVTKSFSLSSFPHFNRTDVVYYLPEDVVYDISHDYRMDTYHFYNDGRFMSCYSTLIHNLNECNRIINPEFSKNLTIVPVNVDNCEFYFDGFIPSGYYSEDFIVELNRYYIICIAVKIEYYNTLSVDSAYRITVKEEIDREMGVYQDIGIFDDVILPYTYNSTICNSSIKLIPVPVKFLNTNPRFKIEVSKNITDSIAKVSILELRICKSYEEKISVVSPADIEGVEYLMGNTPGMCAVNMTSNDLLYTLYSFAFNSTHHNIYYNNLQNVIAGIHSAFLHGSDTYSLADISVNMNKKVFSIQESGFQEYNITFSFINQSNDKYFLLTYSSCGNNNYTEYYYLNKNYKLTRAINRYGIYTDYVYSNAKELIRKKEYYLYNNIEKIIDYNELAYNSFGRITNDVRFIGNIHYLNNEISYITGLDNKNYEVLNALQTNYEYYSDNYNVSNKLSKITKDIGNSQYIVNYIYSGNRVSSARLYVKENQIEELKAQYNYFYDDKNDLTSITDRYNYCIFQTSITYSDQIIVDGYTYVVYKSESNVFYNLFSSSIAIIKKCYDIVGHLIFELVDDVIVNRYIYGTNEDVEYIMNINNPLDPSLHINEDSLLLKTIKQYNGISDVCLYNYFKNNSLWSYGISNNIFIERNINNKNIVCNESILKSDEHENRAILTNVAYFSNSNVVSNYLITYRYLNEDRDSIQVNYDYTIDNHIYFKKLRKKVVDLIMYEYNFSNFYIDDRQEEVEGESNFIDSYNVYINNFLINTYNITYTVLKSYNIASVSCYNNLISCSYLYNDLDELQSEIINDTLFDGYRKINYYFDYNRNICSIDEYDSNNTLIKHKGIAYNYNNTIYQVYVNGIYYNYYYDNALGTITIKNGSDVVVTYQLNNYNQLIKYDNANQDYYYRYYYNSDNVRYKKEKYVRNGNVLDETTYYTYANNLLLFEKRVRGNIITYLTYVYDDKEIVGFWYSLNNFEIIDKYLYVKDPFGKIISIVNDMGSVGNYYTYDSYGNCKVYRKENNSYIIDNNMTHIGNMNPIRYKSYYYDAESDLYYINNIYYDSACYRYLNPNNSTNSFKNVFDFNTFIYCNNNPMNNSSGLRSVNNSDHSIKKPSAQCASSNEIMNPAREIDDLKVYTYNRIAEQSNNNLVLFFVDKDVDKAIDQFKGENTVFKKRFGKHFETIFIKTTVFGFFSFGNNYKNFTDDGDTNDIAFWKSSIKTAIGVCNSLVGDIIGGAFGAAVGGPFGSVIGSVVGSFIERVATKLIEEEINYDEAYFVIQNNLDFIWNSIKQLFKDLT